MLTLPASVRLVLPRLLLKAALGGTKIAHQSGFALYGNPPRWHKITAEKPAPKGAPVAAHPEAAGKHEPAKHFTDERWAALKLPDTNVNAPTYNKALDKLREWSEAGNVTAIVGAGYGSNTYGVKLAKIANHLLAMHGSPHKVEPGQKAGTHAAVQAAPAEPEVPNPADQTVPAFESYDDGLDWAKKRAKDLGLGWQQYTATDEYKQHVYPMLSNLYASYKADHTEQQTNAGKALQAEMAKLGLKPGDKVTWSQPGPFLSTVTMSGVLKLDGNGVPHVHLDHEIAVAKPGGKIGYTKKLRWQPFMKPAAAHAKAGGNASAPHTEASPAPASAQPADTVPVEPAADPFEGLKLPDQVKEYLLKPSVTMKDGKTISAKEYVDGLLSDGYGNPEYFSAPKGSQAGFLTKPGSPKVTLNDKQMFYADAAFMAKKKAGKSADTGPKEGDTKPAADGGVLVLKNGRWVKQGGDAPADPAANTGALAADQLGKLHTIPWTKQYLPATNSNAKTHNKAVSKIENMAFAGDKAGLQAFIDAKAGAKQTYVKKQVLLAQTALAALDASGGGAPSYKQVDPAPAPAAAPAPADKITELTPKQIEGLKGWFAAGQPASKHPDSWSNLWKKLSPGMKAAVKEEIGSAQAPAAKAPAPAPAAGQPSLAAATKIKVDAPLLENTEHGHNKFWAISVFGATVKTHYGKIGTMGKETVKEYPSEAAAKNAAVKLMEQKKAKGYVYKGLVKHEHDAPGGSVEQGPKDGDTKMGADGLLVFKNGRWHKAGKMLSLSALNSALAGYVVPTNTITAKAKKAALAGDVAMLQQAYQDLLAKGKPLPNTKKVLEVIATAMQAPLVGAPVQQGNPTSASEPAAVSAAVPSAPETVPTPAVDSWQQIGPQEGSNPGGKFRDPSGQDWYVKWPDDAEAAKSEVLAAKLYALAGLSSQDAMLVTKGGKLAIASKWVDIKKAGSPAELAKAPGALEGFAVDAWLGNRDVVGKSLDNLQIGSDGKAHRVDAGGSLEYRAQGAKKPFGPKVDEIDTLRDPKKNPQAAAVFGSISDADLTASVAKVAAISDAQIRATVAEFGPGDAAAKKKLADTLIARKQDLLARFPAATKATKKALDPSALPVDPKSIPKPHDFENWNGPGKGLSSKDYVNKSNAAVEFQMQALAQAGNLTALRQFKFPAINKDTVQPTGEMIPVEKHPSKHVQQYHQDLMQVLEEVANPPEPLKVFRETEIGTLEALDAAFPPKPFGTTVKKAASNEKLGFWVALGAVKNPSKFAPKTTRHYSTKDIVAAKEKYNKASKLAKHFISSVQASGSYNDLFRDGKTHDNAGNSLQDVAKAALAHATEMPEGTTIYRWQAMSPQMVEHILSAKEGTVFQATGPMCTSYDPTATKSFGKHRVVIRYAKGAKAVESFASGAFKYEKEVTTLPNSRFVILSRKMVPDVEHGNPTGDRLELEILMLPPDLGL